MSIDDSRPTRVVARLRAARLHHGYSQMEVARRMQSTQAAVARLEGGGRDPRLSTLRRYAHAVGQELAVVGTGEAGHATRDIGQDVRRCLSDATADEAFRHVVQFVDDLRRGGNDWWVPQPTSTGSRRWDALLAGVVELVARDVGIAVPGWTAAPSRFLDEIWFVVEDILGRPAPGLAVHAFQHAPAELAVRGVMLDRASLASV